MIFPTINSFPTYWENGMKLGADHFQHLEESIEDAVRDVRATGLAANNGFGLLPHSPFSLQNAQGGTPQSVRVILTACRAILPGGYRVEILPENIQQRLLPSQPPFVEFIPNVGVRYHLYLSVGTTRRVPAGKPETRPIRHPYLVPDYQLEILSHDKRGNIQGIAPNKMKIAEWENGRIIDGYIPPTLLINGFPMLEQWHQFLQNQLVNIYRVCVQVIKEYRVKDPARAEFCLPIVQFTKTSQGFFKHLLPGKSPLHMISYFVDLAGLIESLLETSDKDFLRTHLKGGNSHQLLPGVKKLVTLSSIDTEEIAALLVSIRQLNESLLETVKSLVTYIPPQARMGDRDVTSG